MRIFDILTEQQLFEALTIDKGSPAANRRFAVDTVLQTEFTNLFDRIMNCWLERGIPEMDALQRSAHAVTVISLLDNYLQHKQRYTY